MEHQEPYIASFSEQRDELMREQVILVSKNEELQKTNLELTISNSQLNTEINEKRGALEAMDSFEEDRAFLISQELSALIAQKTEISTINNSIKNENLNLEIKKNSLIKDIELFNEYHNLLETRTYALNQVVERFQTNTDVVIDKINTLIGTMSQ